MPSAAWYYRRVPNAAREADDAKEGLMPDTRVDAIRNNLAAIQERARRSIQKADGFDSYDRDVTELIESLDAYLAGKPSRS